MNVSVILPTFREKENIAGMIRALDALHLNGLEIIVADDHSPDGTAEAAMEAAGTVSTPVRVEQNPGPRGLSPSVVHGFAKASGDILVCMDADGQHRPEDLPGLLAEFVRDPAPALIVGSRHVPGGGFTEKWNLFRVMCSDGAAFAARLVLGGPLNDPMSGFFAVRRDAYERVAPHLSPVGFKIMLELAFLFTLTKCDAIVEHPITFAMRQHGESKLSGRVMAQYLAMLWRCFRTRSSLRKKLSAAN